MPFAAHITMLIRSQNDIAQILSIKWLEPHIFPCPSTTERINGHVNAANLSEQEAKIATYFPLICK